MHRQVEHDDAEAVEMLRGLTRNHRAGRRVGVGVERGEPVVVGHPEGQRQERLPCARRAAGVFDGVFEDAVESGVQANPVSVV